MTEPPPNLGGGSFVLNRQAVRPLSAGCRCLARASPSSSAVAVGELDGRPIVVSGSHDSTVRVWDLGTGGNPRVIRLDVGVTSGDEA